MSDDVAIEVAHVSKEFKLPHERHTSVKGAIINLAKSGKRNRTFERQQVLKDVSFEIKKGEFFGIVGRNGSGKSTLLKMLAGIYLPSKGQIQVNGKLTPFIELGVGFNPELTGRENVFLNGALLGFNRKEMEAMYKDIVEFAELEKFMDQKLKNYSSGMQVRLAFSIAIRAKTDILLLDEVLAVGDAAFQRKCFAYFGELKRNKQTVVFISHDMGSVRKYCDKAILIDNGKVVERGSIETVIEKYTGLFLESTSAAENSSTDNGIPLGMSPTGATDKSKMRILQATVCNAKGAKTTMLSDTDMNITVNIEVQALANVTDFVPGVIVQNTQGEFITASNSRWAGEQAKHALSAGERVTVSFELPNIYEKGDYIISANVVSDNLDTFYDWKNGFSKIYVDRPTETGASVNPRFKVRYR